MSCAGCYYCQYCWVCVRTSTSTINTLLYTQQSTITLTPRTWRTFLQNWTSKKMLMEFFKLKLWNLIGFQSLAGKPDILILKIFREWLLNMLWEKTSPCKPKLFVLELFLSKIDFFHVRKSFIGLIMLEKFWAIIQRFLFREVNLQFL